MTGTTYYHGGRPGRKLGENLLPPSITRVQCLSDYGAAGVHLRNRVYVTTDQSAALIYAAGWPDGVIYEVEPIGELEPDPDCTLDGLSYQCQRARVLRVIRVSRSGLDAARHALGWK